MLTVPGGYLDLQINGGWGHHFSDDPTSIWEVGAMLVEHGVTQFLPTLVSDGFDRWEEAVAVLRNGPPADWAGARPVGLHLEGPWLAPSRAGAHARSAIRPIDPSVVAELATEVRLVTLAPELDGALAVIAGLTDRGIVVSMGHSNAVLDQVVAAIDAGATMGTHLFNAMSGLGHRAPGLAAGLLLDERVSFGMIADGFHVDRAMVRLARQAAPERLVLVSDAVSLLGISSVPVASLPDGTLAGATIGIDQAVRNLARFCEIALVDATIAASVRPRTVLALDALPDTFTELDDAGVVRRTVIEGVAVYER